MKRLKGWRTYIGLMFRTRKTESLLFDFGNEKIQDIHSIWVFFPFIALWFDDNYNLVSFYKAEPFRLYMSSIKPARYLIEVPL